MEKNTLVFFEEKDLISPENFSKEEKSILDTINLKVAGGNSLTDILEFLFEETRKLFSCDRMDVAFIEDNATRMVLKSVRTVYQPVLLKKG
ncbi:MAG TPA: hypothetical protein PK986_06515, partial [Spirochaetota bacterium]|nr:hypothetical protein [Spirochaetota bacterium]